jgi:hypothetical protein
METDLTRDAGRGADAVGKAVADALDARGGQSSSGGGQTVPEQIEALARLRDQGNITAAEYEKKKAELLEKM